MPTKKNHAPPPGAPETDIVKPRGVGLKESEWTELERIAQETGQTSHAVTTYAIRFFIKQYNAGKIKTEPKQTQRLPDL